MFVRPPIGRRFPPRRGGQPSGNRQPDELQADEQQSDEQQINDEFYPALYDVLQVRHIFLQMVASEGLPLEVVDMIVDAAEYWPSNEFKLEEKRTIQKDVDQAVLCTSPLCYDEKTLDTASPKLLQHRTIHPCRKIIFSIVSRDQGGYSAERRGSGPDRPNMYDGSYTWFDAEVIHNAHEASQKDVVWEKMNPHDKNPKHYAPDDPLLLPRDNALQVNRARIYQAKRHTIVWHHLDNTPADSADAEELKHSQGRGRGTHSGKQVREMELGDSIIVWARARFPGWTNYVDELSVRVFWAV
ncbi:hypothetical protein BDW59DRAFT_147440 [Aspergillus cavernicola]|uniref:Uncharacterized protein n=1 Tax=Aspergillus cavernicola TaxID=176166 RepID=A0ABR4IB33_9EURO